jgi:hypothetical protein
MDQNNSVTDTEKSISQNNKNAMRFLPHGVKEVDGSQFSVNSAALPFLAPVS